MLEDAQHVVVGPSVRTSFPKRPIGASLWAHRTFPVSKRTVRGFRPGGMFGSGSMGLSGVNTISKSFEWW